MQNYNSHDENRAHLADMHRSAARRRHIEAGQPKPERTSLFSRVRNIIQRRPEGARPQSDRPATGEAKPANRAQLA